MDTILEFLGEVIFKYLLSIPGGFIRWLYFKLIGKPKALSVCIKDNPILNGIISVITIVLIVSVLVNLFNET